MSLDTQLLEILVCPKCKGDLEYREAESSLICHACALRSTTADKPSGPSGWERDAGSG